MGRIRSIKPEFFSHFELFELERTTCLPVRLGFAGLWTQADRQGRFKWKPMSLKVSCLPFDQIDFEDVLDALCKGGYIIKFSWGGKEFGEIISWLDHQSINGRETPSKIPSSSEGLIIQGLGHVAHASPTRHDNARGEGKGREGKGREGSRTLTVENKTVSTVKKTKTKFSEEHMALAQTMRADIEKEFSGTKINIEKWADEVRKLNVIDEHPMAEILKLWQWIRNHNNGSFSWAQNIQSVMKLRQRNNQGIIYYEVLKAQAIREYNNRTTAANTYDEPERTDAEYISELDPDLREKIMAGTNDGLPCVENITPKESSGCNRVGTDVPQTALLNDGRDGYQLGSDDT